MANEWQWGFEGNKPLPPKNVTVSTAYQKGTLDVRWEDPTVLARNASYTIVGVNIYRSEASDRGPFRRINEFPVGGTFFRDQTTYSKVDRETVRWETSWVFKGDAPNSRQWTFRTQKPISKRYVRPPMQDINYADSPSDVQFFVNGEEFPVAGVFGRTGDVTIVNSSEYDVGAEVFVAPGIPGPDDVVEVSYYTPTNHIVSGLDTNVWYRVSSVAVDDTTPSGYVESPLEWCEPHSMLEVESLDYIWREAMRRNNWILQQGGERVKLFVQKIMGERCGCNLDPVTREFGKQPSQRCMTCYGTGFVGGYEGPYELIIGPDDGERRKSQSQSGRRLEHTYEVWMGPSPLVSQRDFVLRQTGERYSIGPVRRPSNRGNLLQQHFNIAYLDQGDIRYCVPVDGTADLVWPETRGQRCVPTYAPQPVDHPMAGPAPWPVGADPVSHPMMTEKEEICDENEVRGRTKVWENINY